MKMISYWQQYFFRNLIEIIKQGGLPTSYIPVIEDEAEDTMTTEEDGKPDGEDSSLPDSEDDAGDTPPRSLDDPDIKEAARIVRMANKATTSLLQRHMSVGYAKAGRLLDALEELGVVGPYNGSEPREVLPFDEPNDNINSNEEEQP